MVGVWWASSEVKVLSLMSQVNQAPCYEGEFIARDRHKPWKGVPLQRMPGSGCRLVMPTL